MNKRSRKVSRVRTPRFLMSPVSSDEDLPLSLYVLMDTVKQKTPKKAAPRKRTRKAAKVTASTEPRATTSASTNATEIIDLVTPESSKMVVDTVNSKVGRFWKSGSIISSDEDEVEMIKSKTNKKNTSPTALFISDDSDDDCRVIKQISLNSDIPEPSTSSGTGTGVLTDNKLANHVVLLDQVVEKKDENNDNNPAELKDLKSLEDFRKETEEMLKHASSLLDEIRGCKQEPEKAENKEADDEDDDGPKITISSCPICLEPLAVRPAAVTICGHIFCKDCITKTAKTLKKCPTCRSSITAKKIHPIYF